MYSLYALKDPNTDEQRYIGYSKKLSSRLPWHIHSAYEHAKRPVEQWVFRLMEAGQKPVVQVLWSVGNQADARTAEKALIQERVGAGLDLLNVRYNPKGSRDENPDRLR